MVVGGRIGPYEILRVIDSGPRAEIYQVRHRVLDTRLALKLLHKKQSELVARAMIETARLQSSLNHPNVVRVQDAGMFDDRPFYVAEWIEGWTLLEWVLRYGPLPPEVAMRFMKGVVRGVLAMHEVRIVHRDLNPTNILVDKKLTPRVNDMALAKRLVPGQGKSLLSVEMTTMGTPEYMAPEQIKDPGAVDLRADLWTLGVLLYELIAKEVPFHGETSAKTMWQVMQGTYVPLRERHPEVPYGIDVLVGDLLQVNPDRRVRTVGELLARIESLT